MGPTEMGPAVWRITAMRGTPHLHERRASDRRFFMDVCSISKNTHATCDLSYSASKLAAVFRTPAVSLSRAVITEDIEMRLLSGDAEGGQQTTESWMLYHRRHFGPSRSILISQTASSNRRTEQIRSTRTKNPGTVGLAIGPLKMTRICKTSVKAALQ